MIREIFISMRPRQWLKNGFVLAALIFSRRFLDGESLGRALLAFGGFCLLSSAVYLINDLVDRFEDRGHKRKSLRPIASGRLGPFVAVTVAFILAFFSLGVMFGLSLSVGWGALTYFILMVLYTFVLKKVIYLDVLVISFGFLIRVWVGGQAVGIAISEWLFACTFLISLFLVLCKRKENNEDISSGTAVLSRRVIYPSPRLDFMIALVTFMTGITYLLYVIDGRTRSQVSPFLYLTVPLVWAGIGRYLFLVYRHSGGSEPELLLCSDRYLLGIIVLWVAAVVGILFWVPA